MNFEIETDIGASPILFGMTSEQVARILGPAPHQPKINSCGKREDFDAVGINYDSDDRVAEICFRPDSGVRVRFRGHDILGDACSDPNKILRIYESEPTEVLGFLVYRALGINTCGFHDDDSDQKALNVFKNGYWDEILGAEQEKKEAEQGVAPQSATRSEFDFPE